MKNIAEKVVISGAVLVVTAVVLAIALRIQALVYVTFALLCAVSVFYAAVQVYVYLKGGDQVNYKTQLIVMIVSFVIMLAIIVLSIFVFAGKLFAWY